VRERERESELPSSPRKEKKKRKGKRNLCVYWPRFYFISADRSPSPVEWPRDRGREKAKTEDRNERETLGVIYPRGRLRCREPVKGREKEPGPPFVKGPLFSRPMKSERPSDVARGNGITASCRGTKFPRTSLSRSKSASRFAPPFPIWHFK
jgi:hypothetical protein